MNRAQLTALLFAGCTKPPEPTLEQRRFDARQVLLSHCAECHLPALPTALPGALRVFDLSRADWQATMSDAQLRDARSRLAADLVPTRRNDETKPLQVSAGDQRLFGAFVEAELAARGP